MTIPNPVMMIGIGSLTTHENHEVATPKKAVVNEVITVVK